MVIILCMHPANEKWCYTVTPSLIGWAHTKIDPCCWSDWFKTVLLLNKNLHHQCATPNYTQIELRTKLEKQLSKHIRHLRVLGTAADQIRSDGLDIITKSLSCTTQNITGKLGQYHSTEALVTGVAKPSADMTLTNLCSCLP